MAKKQSPSTLLWFIRRKAYVPLCEIRRRFELESEEVEGGFISDSQGNRLFLGLPQTACTALEKLWGQGKIGLDLSVEFDCRVVIGVFPMVPSRDLQESNGKAPRRISAVPAIQPEEEEIPEFADEDENGHGTEAVLAATQTIKAAFAEQVDDDCEDDDPPALAAAQ